MEQLDYLIRTLTYKRSCFELEMKHATIEEYLLLDAKVEGLQIAITEIYKLVGESNG